jgi:hypothetical protein
MTALYNDTAFNLSAAAVARLRDNAKRAGMPVPRYFRVVASQLTRIANPGFDLSGGELDRRVDVGLHYKVLNGLHQLCRDLGVPEAAAGELVACATFEPKLHA